MFHQILVRKEDMIRQRFLWRKSPNDELTSTGDGGHDFWCQLVTKLCLIYKKNKNAEEFRSSYGEAADAVISNHYVD